MSGSLIALLVIATVSLLVVRIGATALMMTGLSWDTASFQSYSAFFGVGFTTSEAEMVVNHPVRRRIIRTLILCGNVGLTSALASLVVTFVGSEGSGEAFRSLGLIAAGVVAFYFLTRFGPLHRLTDHLIRLSLQRAGVVRAMDYDTLLRVKAGYSVSEIDVLPGCRLAGKLLRETRPSDAGIIVLGIVRGDGEFLGAPGPADRVEVGDVITVYGRDEAIREIATCGS